MELLGAGRSADVFDLGGGRVLRRYREDRSSEDEARLMEHLRALGYPVPAVHDADGRDLVMERVSGPTMFEVLLGAPDEADLYGGMLGELHERLHRIPAPAWLAEREPARSGGEDERAPDAPEPVVVHRDLHPLNVILSDRGPVVIDWEGAGAGSAAYDVALTVVVTMGTDLESILGAGVEVPPPTLLVDAFLRSCGTDPAPGLASALRYRSADPTLSDGERAWLRQHGPGCLEQFDRVR